jgi:hypothetical protein
MRTSLKCIDPRLFDLDHALFSTSSFIHLNGNGIIVTVITANGNMRDSTVSVTDQLSIPSISLADDIIKPDFGTELPSLPDSV